MDTDNNRQFSDSAGVGFDQVNARHGNLQLEAVDTLSRLARYSEDWNCLAARSPQRVHTLSHAWVSSFFEHLLLDGSRWCCLLVRDNHSLVGVLPLIFTEKQTLGKSCTHLCTPANPHALSLDLLCSAEDREKVGTFVLQGIVAEFPDWFDLRCRRLSDSSPLLFGLQSGVMDYRYSSYSDSRQSYVTTTGDFQEYVRSLSTNFRRNLKRLSRKLQKLNDVRFAFLSGEDALPSWLDTFMAIEASGWKGSEGTAILANERAVRFYRTLVQRLYDRGWLEWHLLRCGDEVFAINMAVRMNGVAYLWKIAFDERHSSYAPGNMLLLKTIEHAFASPDIIEVNCVTYTAWNENWNMQQRPQYELTVWNRQARAFWLGYAPVRTRELLRKVPGVRPVARLVRLAWQRRK
jgi:hypothetical protein